MVHRTHARVLFLVIVLFGSAMLVGVRLTQGQNPDEATAAAAALGPGFTYQGELSSDGAMVNDTCVLIFALYDAAEDGAQLGGTEVENNVSVEDGRFTVVLNDQGDFGPNAFNGEARWLETSVRCSEDPGFSNLGRQPLTAAPYASYALNAGSAAAAPWDGISGVPADIADGDDDTTYSAGAGLALNNGEFSAQGVPYANVIVVAKSGGDFTHIQAALDSIDNAARDNPYLIWVAPGVYEEQVTMKPFVDIEGAGENMTTIRWTGGEESPLTSAESATVEAAENSQLRRLTVEADGAAGAEPDRAFATGVRVHSAGNIVLLDHVTIDVSGGTGFIYGLYNRDSATTRVKNSTISAFNSQRVRAISTNSLLVVEHSALGANLGSDNAAGLFMEGGDVYVHNSQVQGADHSISRHLGDAYIAGSMLAGPVNTTTLTCVHSHDAAYTALSSSCQ